MWLHAGVYRWASESSLRLRGNIHLREGRRPASAAQRRERAARGRGAGYRDGNALRAVWVVVAVVQAHHGPSRLLDHGPQLAPCDYC